MKTLETTIQIYAVRELTNEATKQAYNEWKSTTPYENSHSMLRSVNEFCRLFPVKLVDTFYLNGIPYIQWKFTHVDYLKSMHGEELFQYLMDIYGSTLFTSDGQRHAAPLTGYFADYFLLDPLYRALETREDVEYDVLLDECLDSYAKVLFQDMQEFYSFDAFLRACDEHGYMFLENGRMF
jgi:hypothetical protein